jgi:hypothetical protein
MGPARRSRAAQLRDCPAQPAEFSLTRSQRRAHSREADCCRTHRRTNADADSSSRFRPRAAMHCPDHHSHPDRDEFPCGPCHAEARLPDRSAPMPRRPRAPTPRPAVVAQPLARLSPTTYGPTGPCRLEGVDVAHATTLSQASATCSPIERSHLARLPHAPLCLAALHAAASGCRKPSATAERCRSSSSSSSPGRLRRVVAALEPVSHPVCRCGRVRQDPHRRWVAPAVPRSNRRYRELPADAPLLAGPTNSVLARRPTPSPASSSAPTAPPWVAFYDEPPSAATPKPLLLAAGVLPDQFPASPRRRFAGSGRCRHHRAPWAPGIEPSPVLRFGASPALFSARPVSARSE